LLTADFNSKKTNAIHQQEKLDNPTNYLNRELSWIRFNARILEEAKDEWHPLLERVKFLAICGSNLDEFFMTRIARLIKKVKAGSDERSMDGMSISEQIEATRKEIIPLIEKHADCWKNDLIPALKKEEIHIKQYSDLTEKWKGNLREYFRSSILPTLNIPKEGYNSSSIENLHINLLVTGFAEKEKFYIIDIAAEKFGRLIKIHRSVYQPEAYEDSLTIEQNFVFLEDLIQNNLDLIFTNEQTLKSYAFRLTRNQDIDILMDESADFLKSVKKSLTSRKSGFPSRLEFEKKTPNSIRNLFSSSVGLTDNFIYEFDGPLGLVDLWQLYKINRLDIKDKTFLPSILPLLTPEKNIFTTITKRDIVLYHPYDGFEIIIDLIKEAAQDRNVLKICITMYRMDAKSPIVDALMEAAKNGVKVTAIIELKAKFDEENNILLASRLREAGILTIYNFPNFKVHAKLCLIVRKEKKELARYSHIGSGNYNAVTAKIYGDIGYLTARPDVGLELEELFTILVNGLQEKDFKHLLVAPKTLKTEILKRIDREITYHRKTGKGYLAFKLNNLEEKDVIKALYKASKAGIKIDLNVRALCCLKPGIRGVSENISVISIVGRFLEHARIYYFQGGNESEMIIGSSDLMFRNLNERIEVLFSVPDPQIRNTILENMLKVHLHDNVKARKLLPDGTYQRVKPKDGEKVINSQLWLIQHRGIWHEYAKYIPKM
jgi:polyphosphate kinase